jgi:general secretion pathway protein B
MSYILNALRKSEQERLAQQSDTVTGRILADQPQPRPKASKLIILLIIGNLIVVAGLFWLVRKEPGAPLAIDSQKTLAAERSQVKPVIAQPTVIAPPAKPVLNEPGPISPSIAELAALRKASAAQLPVAKPMVEKKPVLAQLKSGRIESEMEPNAITPAQVERIKRAEKKPAAAAEGRAVPFLFELPPDFRDTVPNLNINVFVYSKQPAERFVMIDMVKYTVGDRIKESMELKEIRPDSLVVEYNNQAFQIKRP